MPSTLYRPPGHINPWFSIGWVLGNKYGLSPDFTNPSLLHRTHLHAQLDEEGFAGELWMSDKDFRKVRRAA